MSSERHRGVEAGLARLQVRDDGESPPPLDEFTVDSEEFYYDPEAYGDDVVPGEAGYTEEELALLYEEIEGDGEEIDVGFENPDNEKLEYVGGLPVVIGEHYVNDSFLKTEEPGAVSRIVIIDAANVLHGFTPLMDITNNSVPLLEDQKVDGAYILSLVRFFVFKGIECMVVILHKYMLDTVTENTFILRTLQELGLLMVMDRTYDDLMLFAVAGEFDGVILSEDQFKHEQTRREFMTENVKNALNLRVSPIYPRAAADFLPKSEWGKVSRNGHFVVDHLMRFAGSTEQLRDKFFSSPARGGHRFELVQEKYETWLKRKDKVLKSLDFLLAKIQPIMQKVREDVPTLLPRGN